MKLGQTSYEKGIEKGIDRGRNEGETNMLLRMLHERFGPLSDGARQRVETMTTEQREKLAKSFVTASSLGELGLNV